MLYLLGAILAVLILIFSGGRKMAVDLTAQFAKLDKSIADLPVRIAAVQANAIQPAEVEAAADARASQIDALNLPPAAPVS